MSAQVARPRSTTAAGNAAGLGAALTLLATEAQAISAVVPDTFVLPSGGATTISCGGSVYFGFTPDCDVLDTAGTFCTALVFCGFVGGCTADLYFSQGDSSDVALVNACSGDIPALDDGTFIGCGTPFACSGSLDLFGAAPDDLFYVGFAFTPASTTDTHYGFVELSYNMSDGVTVYGWAYDSTPLTNVVATKVIPEPGMVTMVTGLIALAGVAAFRMKRSRPKAVESA
ncbi:MAG: hypothetical protein ACFE0O_08380 [Opitutales bacterium]